MDTAEKKVLFLFIAVITFVGYLLYYQIQLNSIALLSEKYINLNAITETNNYSTEVYIYGILWLCLVWTFLFVIFGFLDHYEYNDEKTILKILRIGVIRASCLGSLIVFVIFGLKFMLIPIGMLGTEMGGGHFGESFSDKIIFDVDFATTRISRCSARDVEEIVYNRSKVYIKYKNDVLLHFNSNALQGSSMGVTDNQIVFCMIYQK